MTLLPVGRCGAKSILILAGRRRSSTHWDRRLQFQADRRSRHDSFVPMPFGKDFVAEDSGKYVVDACDNQTMFTVGINGVRNDQLMPLKPGVGNLQEGHGGVMV